MPNHQQASRIPSRWPSHRQCWVRTPDGVDISVREWGRPEGWPILFVHGVAQSHLSFLPQYASHLADHHRLIAYDLRGHGESAKPLDPLFYVEGRRWSDELQAVIDGVAATKPILVGWSLGGRGASPIPDRPRRSDASAVSISCRRVLSKIRRCWPRHHAPTSPADRSRWPRDRGPYRICAHASFGNRRKTILPSRWPTTSSCRVIRRGEFSRSTGLAETGRR